jgi:F-type H+-transporting ATPase subunit b
MELIMPQLGLFFWTVVVFLSVFFILRKFAWKSILQAIDERNAGIEKNLKAAAEAEKRLAELNASNEKLLAETRAEQTRMLAEATREKNEIVERARAEANEQKARIIAEANRQVDLAKTAALAEIKNLAANLSLELAEKVLRNQLKDRNEQQTLVTNLLKDVKLN